MSSEHDRYRDDVAAYALGALSQLEATAVERHIMRCDTCAGELERLRSVVDSLPVALTQHRAPAELKQTVIAAVERNPREPATPGRPRPSADGLGRPLPRRPAVALASTALAALAFGAGALVSGDDRRVVAMAPVSGRRVRRSPRRARSECCARRGYPPSATGASTSSGSIVAKVPSSRHPLMPALTAPARPASPASRTSSASWSRAKTPPP